MLLSDGLALWFALQGTQNLWVGYVGGPIALLAALMALSYWHPNARVQIVFRVAIPVLLLLSIILVVLIEDTGTFSLITGPIENLVLVAASIVTLIACASRLDGSLLKQDWFWIGIGLALRYGSSASLDPIARILVGQDMSMLAMVYQINAGIDIVASLLIVGGMLCQIPPLRASSGASSPASSPSASSSSRSAPPW